MQDQLKNIFKISYPEQLPVSQEIEAIRRLINANKLVIVCGETGSGKTTQLPKLLYEMGFASKGIIGHTQPRKVAARTIMHRINFEIHEANTDLVNEYQKNSLNSSTLDIVGYKVRFQDKTHKNTAIKLMTDGILLQEIGHDHYLRQYSALIIDEAHERSLNIDFILGYLKTILKKRPDLKVIITSATIDNQKLSKFFDNAPVINVQGKTYPVDIIYQELNESEELNAAIFKAIESCYFVDDGNVLVFLPGEREIKDCISFLRKTSLKHCEILPLFSRQNEIEQNLVFTQNGQRKIIVTTNVAETSLTIPGIKFVIDSGLARVKRYNIRNRVEQLLIEPVSKASSKQRAGRAGRTSPGMCIRLFTENEFNLRKEYTDPEIIRSNLANVILRLIGIRLGNPQTFPFLDLPLNTAYNDGFKTLYQISAIDEANAITNLGKQLVKIPLDVYLARMLIAASTEFDCLNEVTIIVAFLAIIDPREIPIEYQHEAREKHQIWADKKSDFVAVLNLWNWYNEEVSHKKSNKKLQEKCYAHFLSYQRMREWHELYGQLKEVMGNLGYTSTKTHDLTNIDNYRRVHQSLLSGLLNNIGQKDLVEDLYVGTQGKRFILHPSSQITKSKWVMSANLSQTSRLFARINAYIEPDWLVPLTRHLVKFNYSSECFDKKRGEVVAIQHILFGGLEIAKIKVAYSKLNPVLSREIFIKEGLVLNELGKKYKFIQHNLEVIKNLEQLEDKLRLSFVIIEDELFEYYTNIIPEDITDTRSFDSWCKGNEDKLCIKQDLLINKLILDNSYLDLYPDFLIINNNKLKLNYIFNPYNAHDGVTATIFLDRLGQVNDEDFSFLVPGLIREKITFILKSLPKASRIKLGNINEFITKFLEKKNDHVDFAVNLSEYLNVEYKIDFKAYEIKIIDLPKHLYFHFRIMEKNKILAEGNNLNELKIQLSDELKKLIDENYSDYEIKNITKWIPNLDNLLKPVNKSIGFFGLRVHGKEIDLVIIHDQVKAMASTRKGILQLLKINLNTQIKYLEQKKFNQFKQTAIYLNDVYEEDVLLAESIDFILRMSVNLTEIPKNSDEFQEMVTNAGKNITLKTEVFAKMIHSIATNYHLVKLLSKDHNLAFETEEQLDNLIFPGFLRYTKFSQMEHFPRYLQGIKKRLEKYPVNKDRDLQISKDIQQLYNSWYDFLEKVESNGEAIPQNLYDFKYKIEELRVSLFAQELRTQYPVSLKRLWRELEEYKQ